jgi:hypothetical protein
VIYIGSNKHAKNMKKIITILFAVIGMVASRVNAQNSHFVSNEKYLLEFSITYDWGGKTYTDSAKAESVKITIPSDSFSKIIEFQNEQVKFQITYVFPEFLNQVRLGDPIAYGDGYLQFGQFNNQSFVFWNLSAKTDDEVKLTDSSWVSICHGPYQVREPKIKFSCKRVLAKTTGMSDIEKSKISIYPNPFVDNLIISNLLHETFVRVVDMNGKEIYQQNSFGDVSLDTSSWNPGVYFLYLGDSAPQKIVKY